MWWFKKLARGSVHNTIYDESWRSIIRDLTEWLKMKSAAKFHSNLDPVVAIIENDDVVFLQDFEQDPAERNKAIIHLVGCMSSSKKRWSKSAKCKQI
jgi:hypothetical protein